MATQKAYRLDTKKKIVVLNDEVKLTDIEQADIDMYVRNGWILKHKSVAKSVKAKETAAETAVYTKEYIRKELEKDEAKLAQFEAILKGKGKGHGWFAAKAWFIKNK